MKGAHSVIQYMESVVRQRQIMFMGFKQYCSIHPKYYYVIFCLSTKVPRRSAGIDYLAVVRTS